jgi:hypothetical protein
MSRGPGVLKEKPRPGVMSVARRVKTNLPDPATEKRGSDLLF